MSQGRAPLSQTESAKDSGHYRLRICGPVDAPILGAVMQALADCEWRG